MVWNWSGGDLCYEQLLSISSTLNRPVPDTGFVLTFEPAHLGQLKMDCWRSHYVSPDGSQSSASRVFKTTLDMPISSGQVISTSTLACVPSQSTDRCT